MKRIDVMRQLSTEEMAMTLVSLLAPRIEQVTGKPLADEELEVAAESWVNWLESEHPGTREKLYTRDILAVKFNKDETNFLSENDWDIIKALERMSKADPEGFMSEVLKLVKRLQRRCDGERNERYQVHDELCKLRQKYKILRQSSFEYAKTLHKELSDLKSELKALKEQRKDVQE